MLGAVTFGLSSTQIKPYKLDIRRFGGAHMIVRHIFLVAGYSLTLVGQAVAADLPSKVATPVFLPPPPEFTWTGAYLGINAGYAFDYKRRTSTLNGAGTANAVPAYRPALATLKADGFTGGGQAGYNYEFANGPAGGLVVGIEGDAAYTDLSATVDAVTGGRDNLLHGREAFIGTVRGRVGYAFDRILVYGTGGFAYGKNNAATNFYTGTSLVYSAAGTNMRTGYTYGGGIEYALPTDSFFGVFKSSAVTVKAEYLHYDLGTATFVVPNTANIGLGAYTQRIRIDGDLVRAGLNFKFGVPDVASVVARY